MSSNKEFVDFISEQLAGAGIITSKKMFGEYAIYCNRKIVALICDDQLFIKPTAAGKAFIGSVIEAHPYPGSKPYFLVEDKVDDRDWIAQLVRITADELPEPNPGEKLKRA